MYYHHKILLYNSQYFLWMCQTLNCHLLSHTKFICNRQVSKCFTLKTKVQTTKIDQQHQNFNVFLFDKIRKSHFLRHLSWRGKCNGQRFQFDKILHCLRSLCSFSSMQQKKNLIRNLVCYFYLEKIWRLSFFSLFILV